MDSAANSSAPSNEQKKPNEQHSKLSENDGNETIVSAGKAPNDAGKQPKLEICVTDPEKKGEGMTQFISYKINTVKEIAPGKLQQSSVVRRFSDFAWLHDVLSKKYKGYLIPPIPDKAMLGRFNRDFVTERQRALATFLSRLATHPVLSKSQELELLLHGDDEALANAKSEKIGSADNGALVTFFKDSLHALSQAMGQSTPRPKTDDDVSCEKIEAYTVALSTALDAYSTNVDNHLQRSRAMATSWYEFGLVCIGLGELENANNEANLGACFSKLAICADRLSTLMTKKRDDESMYYHECFKDYIRIVHEVQAMLKTRANALDSYESALQTLERRKHELGTLQGKAGKEEKIAAQQRLIDEAQQKVEANLTELKSITAHCLEEVVRFRQEKYRDLKATVIRFVKGQVEHAKKMAECFESVLPELEALP